MTRPDPDEIHATIFATVENYKTGEFGDNRARALLAMCGLNATEINDLLAPHRSSAFENFKNYKRGPVR